MSNPRCLTRVVIDDDCGVEVAQLQSVMRRIQSMLHDVPQAQREYIANALLNLAVSRSSDRRDHVLAAPGNLIPALAAVHLGLTGAAGDDIQHAFDAFEP
jgi:hypothetical protein